MPQYELKLANRKTVVWSGDTADGAVARFRDTHMDAEVIAWRDYPRTNFVTTAHHSQIDG